VLVIMRTVMKDQIPFLLVSIVNTIRFYKLLIPFQRCSIAFASIIMACISLAPSKEKKKGGIVVVQIASKLSNLHIQSSKLHNLPLRFFSFHSLPSYQNFLSLFLSSNPQTDNLFKKSPHLY